MKRSKFQKTGDWDGMTEAGRKAFSLLELSIVIALIGIIAGAVFVGESFIQTHRLRAVMTDAAQYKVAILQFKNQYGYYPGDFPEATRVWGAIGGTGCTATQETDAPGVSKTTCDGDGDGLVTDMHCESYRIWQHLSNAGLIPGTYPGVSGWAGCPRASSGSADGAPDGPNTPGSALKNSGFSFGSELQNVAGHMTSVVDANAVSGNLYDGDYKNVLYFGGAHWSPAPGPDRFDRYTVAPILMPDDAKAMDAKADDGMPSTGNIRSFKAGGGYAPDCVKAAATPPVYNEQFGTTACSLLFMEGYQNSNDR